MWNKSSFQNANINGFFRQNSKAENVFLGSKLNTKDKEDKINRKRERGGEKEAETAYNKLQDTTKK